MALFCWVWHAGIASVSRRYCVGAGSVWGSERRRVNAAVGGVTGWKGLSRDDAGRCVALGSVDSGDMKVDQCLDQSGVNQSLKSARASPGGRGLFVKIDWGSFADGADLKSRDVLTNSHQIRGFNLAVQFFGCSASLPKTV